MKYFSTRDSSKKVSAAQAIVQGLAPDGGLYVPERIPSVSMEEINELCKLDYRERAVKIIVSIWRNSRPPSCAAS